MVITKINIEGQNTKYGVIEDHMEIASFEDLYTASAVMRFMKGARMERDEYNTAIRAIKKLDKANTRENDT